MVFPISTNACQRLARSVTSDLLHHILQYIEHKVTKVETGYWVTLTYNLYFNFLTVDMEHKPLICWDNNVKTLLKLLLSSPSFLSDGSELAFALQQEYPVDKKKTKPTIPWAVSRALMLPSSGCASQLSIQPRVYSRQHDCLCTFAS